MTWPILRPGPGLALAVEMQPRAGLGQQLGPALAPRRRSGWSSRRRRTRLGSPSGRPQTARTCCSNWLTAQASMVQWPELCGRGASSLTSSRPSRVRNISTASSPTSSSARGDPLGHRHRLARQRPAGSRAGAIGHVEDVVAMPVLDRRRSCARAVGLRAAITDSSSAKSTQASWISTGCAQARHRRGGVGRAVDAQLALAVVAQPHRLQHAGARARAGAAPGRPRSRPGA